MDLFDYLKSEMQQRQWNVARFSEAVDVSIGLAAKWVAGISRPGGEAMEWAYPLMADGPVTDPTCLWPKLSVRVPPALHRRLRLAAVLEGRAIQQIVLEALEQRLKNPAATPDEWPGGPLPG